MINPADNRTSRPEDANQDEQRRRGEVRRLYRRSRFLALMRGEHPTAEKAPPTAHTGVLEGGKKWRSTREPGSRTFETAKQPERTADSPRGAEPGEPVELLQQALLEAAEGGAERPIDAGVAGKRPGDGAALAATTRLSVSGRRDEAAEKPTLLQQSAAASTHVSDSDDAEAPDAPETKAAESDRGEPAYALRPFTAEASSPAAPQAPAPRGGLPADVLQQLIDYTSVRRSADGAFEFHLKLASSLLGGLRVVVSSYGNRRVGLRVSRDAKGRDAELESEVQGLIRELSAAGLDVVDVAIA